MRLNDEIHKRGSPSPEERAAYNQPSRFETQLEQWKAVLGCQLGTRAVDDQWIEARIGVQVLNRANGLGRPILCTTEGSSRAGIAQAEAVLGNKGHHRRLPRKGIV